MGARRAATLSLLVLTAMVSACSPPPDPVDPAPEPSELAYRAAHTATPLSDGSVLVATVSRKYPTFDFYDCAVPSGACTYLGREASGDPVFIGDDS